MNSVVVVGFCCVFLGIYLFRFGVLNMEPTCYLNDRFYFGCVRNKTFLENGGMQKRFGELFPHRKIEEGKCYQRLRQICNEDIMGYMLHNMHKPPNFHLYEGELRVVTRWEETVSKIPFFKKKNSQCRILLNYKNLPPVEVAVVEGKSSCESLKRSMSKITEFFGDTTKGGFLFEFETFNWYVLSSISSVLGMALFFLSFMFFFDLSKRKFKKD